MAKIKDTDYLFLTTRVRSLEVNLLNQDRMEQMLEARTNEDALRVLTDCGYPEVDTVNVDTVNEMLAAERDKTMYDLYMFAPDPAIIDVFKVKYDYHNVKVLLKSEAVGADPQRLLVDTGRVPVKELTAAVRSSEFSGVPTVLADAITKARETLGATKDPQLADFVLDQACFEDMFAIARASESSFLEGYVRINIDAANLRSIVRTLRMGKSTEFLTGVLFAGGNVDRGRILTVVGASGSLEDLFGTTPLKAAAEAGTAAAKGGPLTQFEKLCDDAVTEYVSKARYVSFGEAPIIAYLSAKETEYTAIRIIMTGRLAGLSADVIRERLRETYV